MSEPEHVADLVRHDRLKVYELKDTSYKLQASTCIKPNSAGSLPIASFNSSGVCLTVALLAGQVDAVIEDEGDHGADDRDE